MKEVKWLIGVLVVLVILAAAFGRYLYVSPVDMPGLTGELESHSIQLGELERSFHVYIPGGHREGAPVVFVLHGSNGSGKETRAYLGYEFDQIADRDGIVIVYPDGYERHWNDCRGSADYAANLENVDDPAFFEWMINNLDTSYSIDRDSVFVTGISNGGHMVYRLAWEKPELFAAFAPIVANIPEAANNDCEARSTPVDIAIINGTEDTLNPHEGGLVELFGNTSRGVVLSSMQSFAYWSELAGGGEPTVIDFAEVDGDADTSIRLHASKGQHNEVRLYEMIGSGHVVPSMVATPPRLLGRPAADISGAEELVGFFLSRKAS